MRQYRADYGQLNPPGAPAIESKTAWYVLTVTLERPKSHSSSARFEHRGGQHLFGNAVLRPLIQVDTVLKRSEPLGANQEPKVDASSMPIG
jgi:hypothetical protein